MNNILLVTTHFTNFCPSNYYYYYYYYYYHHHHHHHHHPRSVTSEVKILIKQEEKLILNILPLAL